MLTQETMAQGRRNRAMEMLRVVVVSEAQGQCPVLAHHQTAPLAPSKGEGGRGKSEEGTATREAGVDPQTALEADAAGAGKQAGAERVAAMKQPVTIQAPCE